MKLQEFDENQREFFEERAAILEYEANLSRDKAEYQAYLMTLEWFNK